VDTRSNGGPGSRSSNSPDRLLEPQADRPSRPRLPLFDRLSGRQAVGRSSPRAPRLQSGPISEPSVSTVSGSGIDRRSNWAPASLCGAPACTPTLLASGQSLTLAPWLVYICLWWRSATSRSSSQNPGYSLRMRRNRGPYRRQKVSSAILLKGSGSPARRRQPR